MEYASWEEYMDCEQVPLVNRMGEILARQGKHDKYSLEDVRLAEAQARHELRDTSSDISPATLPTGPVAPELEPESDIGTGPEMTTMLETIINTWLWMWAIVGVLVVIVWIAVTVDGWGKKR